MADKKLTKKNWWLLLALPAWTLASFVLAQLLLVAVVTMLNFFGQSSLFANMNEVVFGTVTAAITYVLALVIAVFVPLWIIRRRTSMRLLGVTDWPSWLDMLLGPVTFIVYIICSGIFMLIVTSLFAGVDVNQEQQLLFTQSMLGARWQYALAFITLVVMAPLAEELLFRGYLYGKLRNTAPIWVSILITSVTFGLAHLWAPGSPLQWAVAIDTFVLSIFLCLAREYTGAIWVPILVHMIKNGLAFYLLFINPNLVEQIQASVMPML